MPRKYLEKVGDDGFKKAPVGAGPYRFVSFNPGDRAGAGGPRAVLAEGPEREAPRPQSRSPTRPRAWPCSSAARPTSSTCSRASWPRRSKRTPGLTLKPTPIVSTHWLVFLDQWDPKSPWADRRVRLAANHAIDRQAVNEAITLGFSRITWSIIPASFDFFWQPPAYAYDPARAKQLLAEAGYPNGFDAGDLWCDAATATMSEALVNYLQAVGHPGEAPAARARRLLQGLPGEEAEEPALQHQRRLRQRRHPARELRGRRAVPTSTAAIPTSTGSSASRPASSTASAARRPCTGSSSSCTTRPCTRRSGSSASSTRTGRGWRSRASGSSPAGRSPRPTRISGSCPAEAARGDQDPRRRGSSVSRSASPSRFVPNTARLMASPG